MKLNLVKRAFGIFLRKFVGFMVTYHGTEANLEKIHTVLDMASLKTMKKVQPRD